MIELNNGEINFTIQAVRRAALLVARVQAEMVHSSLTKDDRSPVTVADFASQALVARLLIDQFPHDPLVAEEDASALRSMDGQETLSAVTHFVQVELPDAIPEQTCSWIDHGKANGSRRFWTLDPIDGTKGFLRGDQYAVALALVVDGKVEIGALGCPKLSDGYQSDYQGEGSLVIAARGQGTWVTPLANPGPYRRLTASRQNDPQQARLLRSFESGHTNVDQIGYFSAALGIIAEPVRMDSQAKYSVLAAGEGDLLLRLLTPSRPDYKEKIWDQAAGSLVIEEAGGQISDINGKPLDFTTGRELRNNRGILASNYHLHQAALHALGKIG